MCLFFMSVSCSGGLLDQKETVPLCVSTIAGAPGVIGAADGTGSAARFYLPADITSDTSNLYIADINNNIIRKIDINTYSVTTFAGTSGVSGYADAALLSAQFLHPSGICIYGTTLYVSDSGNSVIRAIDLLAETVGTLAGTAETAGYADGALGTAQLNTPQGITTDGTYLYVCDTGNNAIRQVDMTTGIISTLAGSPIGALGTADGVGTAARFNAPCALVYAGGALYVADSSNNAIRRIDIATKTVTTFAGSAGLLTAGFQDGTGTSARFEIPKGITTDGTYLYVADTYNSTIRKIELATGAVRTFAGVAKSTGTDDGIGLLARFKYPAGMTACGLDIYVCDTNNNTIRRMPAEMQH